MPSLRSHPTPFPLALRVLAWRARPLLLLIGLLGACAIAARTAAPPPAPTVPVVVAGTDLPAGHTVTAADLRTVHLPRGTTPSGATATTAPLLGARLVVDVPEGLPVVDAHLTRSRFPVETPSGTVAVPVHLADPAVAALLRPGDRVDLVAGPLDGWAAEPEPAVLAAAALVLEVRTESAATSGLGLLGDAGTGEPLVVVAVAAEDGHRIASAAGGSLGAVLVEGS